MKRAGWWLLAVWLLTSSPAAAGPYDPALRFFTLKTAHFQIHYHRGEEAMAERLSRIAEATHARLSTAWQLSVDRRTEVVLVDQADVSNGTATVVPWNAIVIYPVPPTGAETIGDTDDWLEYVFVHEYAHVLHLDQSRGWARLARGLFGRTIIGFPNLTLPLWQIEGLATLIESEGGLGRLHGGDFREVVDAAGRAGRLEPLDRVNGGLADWPAGQGWYAYGARFHQFLARTYGAERLGELAAATAAKPPFITSGAFSEVFGKSLGQLWKEFQATVARDGRPAPADAPRHLTHLGYLVDAPREGADGAIYFATADADRFPGIYRLARGATAAERVVSRYGGTGISMSDREMLFDQLELVRGAALMSDLYARDLKTGRTRRLTREARLSMADRSPDGTRIAAVQVVAGARDLVVLDAASLMTASSAVRATSLRIVARAGGGEAVFANPRWSPDGRTLAAERRQRHGLSTIVLLDGSTLRERGTIVGDAADRLVNPTWSPDGALLYYAHAVGERPFQLRAVDLAAGGRISLPRPLPEVAGGARAPLALRDGRIVFVGYSTSGYDLFELPGADSVTPGSPEGLPEVPDTGPAGSTGPARPAGPAEHDYTPWSTLAPRGWLPEVEHRDGRWRAGASAVGVDVLQRHVVTATATWALTSGEISSDLAPRTRPDWEASYTYQRWQPSLYLASQDRTSLFQAVTEPGALVPVAQREQTVDVGGWYPVRRIRWVQTVLAAYHVERLTTDLPLASDRRTRAGVRGAWNFSSARRYGRSISQEDGVTLAATGETFAPSLGSDGRSDAVTGDARAYLPVGIPHAVAALRAAFAASQGDARVRRRFRLGGSGGDPVAGSFGSDAVSLLRGFPDEVFVGDRVALLNLELRMPLWSVQRGWGTWPLFLQTLHATGFADVGNAWTGQARWADRKVGYGAEISADVVAGFGLPLTWTAGIGWGDDGAGVITGAREVYFRVGRSF